MTPQSIAELITGHAFFAGMRPEWLELIAACGRNVVFRPGEVVAREGERCEAFYALRRGRVAVELHAPGVGARTIQTLGDGAILGWSWLFPPHLWKFDLRAVETTHAVHFDTSCLLPKCEASPEMGYDFMRRFSGVMSDRLEATRLQLLDVYGRPGNGDGTA